MKKCLLLSACLLALGSSPVMVQMGVADVVIVKVSEGGITLVAISYGEGKIEMLDLPADSGKKT
jgi:hypothetical protein